MGTADLRAAFNSVTQPLFSCSRATLEYENASDVQWQRLTFSGTAQDGTPFSVRSERLRPETDVNIAAQEVAKAMLTKGETKP